jgi:hypothetical protein
VEQGEIYGRLGSNRRLAPWPAKEDRQTLKLRLRWPVEPPATWIWPPV